MSAVRTRSQGAGAGAFAATFAYLAVCCAALFLPGLLADAAGLSVGGRRMIALVSLITAAFLVVGAIAASLLWAAPPLILLAGNAIWTLDTIDLEVEAQERTSDRRAAS